LPAKTERKILEAGTSKAVALPPDWLRALRLDKGDTIEVLYDYIVLIKPKNVKFDLAFLSKELEILASVDAEMPGEEAST
jgi:antitoxin component of MazEF toxin-antitoxin module